MQNFYIIQRSGAITEIPFTEQNYKSTYEQWINGGRLIVKPRGGENPIGINAVDITNIFDENAYESYIKQIQPKLYIKNGVWFDGKFRKEVYAEVYIERQRREQKALEASKKEEIITPEQQIKIAEWREKIRNQLSTAK